MSTRDEYESSELFNVEPTSSYYESVLWARDQLSDSLEQGFKMAGKITSKILHYQRYFPSSRLSG